MPPRDGQPGPEPSSARRLCFTLPFNAVAAKWRLTRGVVDLSSRFGIDNIVIEYLLLRYDYVSENDGRLRRDDTELSQIGGRRETKWRVLQLVLGHDDLI